jgi:2-methylcitrate dehydratase PrpD
LSVVIPAASPAAAWRRWDTHVDALKTAARRRATRPATPRAAAAARRILLDTLGCALAGRQATEVAAFEERLSALESGPFTFPGGRRLSLNAATQVLAMAATWDEACEGHALAHGRPGVPAVAALFPLAFANDRGLDATVDALALAYEVGARAGAWLRIRPGMHVDANWPALGVAAGAARLLGLGEDDIVRAIDIAACQLATSLYLPVAAGRTSRNTYLGHSAQAGFTAACAAAAGIDAPQDALACYAESFAAAAPEPLPDAQADLITSAYLKPHAAVRHAHYGAEMARAVRDELRGDTAGIARIALSIYREATVYCGNRAPATPIQAQFSLSFGVAAMLRFGVLDATVYRPGRFDDAELRRLEALVQVEIDPAYDTQNKRGASLAVSAGYKEFEHDVRAIPGDAALPLSNEEVAAKFMRYALPGVPEEKTYVFANAMLASEVDVKLRALWDLLF